LYFNLASNEINENDQAQFEDNTLAKYRKKATIIHNEEVKTELFVLLKRFSQTKPFDSKKKAIDVLKLLYSLLLLLVHFHKRQKFVAGEQSLKRELSQTEYDNLLRKKPKKRFAFRKNLALTF
jgi:hypothetical protein